MSSWGVGSKKETDHEEEIESSSAYLATSEQNQCSLDNLIAERHLRTSEREVARTSFRLSGTAQKVSSAESRASFSLLAFVY